MKVIDKQKNSKMCILCGMDNPYSIKAPFYNMEDKSVCSIFEFPAEFQSYPERVHGGLITAMLDELGGRAYWSYGETGLAVTMSLEVKFRKPVPYNVKLKGIGKIIRNTSRFFESEAYIYSMDNILLADAKIKYIKMENKDICSNAFTDEMPYMINDDVNDIDI